MADNADLTSSRRPSPNAIVVMKFGGTSVANLERIRRVSELVEGEVKAGNEVAVVVSAMSGETNRLVGLVDKLDGDSDPNGNILAALLKMNMTRLSHRVSKLHPVCWRLRFAAEG